MLDSGSGNWGQQTTLSTANNSESDASWTTLQYITGTRLGTNVSREDTLILSSKATYYLNSRTTSNNHDQINFYGDISPTTIRAVCAYL